MLQVSLFDSTKTSDLRSLFAIGGRWTIKEIIDLEVIYRKIFDADVIPAIFIAENREPKEDDVVSVRTADSSCVKINPGNALPEFDLGSLPENLIAYRDLFSPDGRILTRLTSERIPVLRKLQANGTLADVAKRFWVRKNKSRIVEWTDEAPNDPRWEQQRMISGGIAFRSGEKTASKNGLAVYKGENIIAAELQGDPVLPNADIDRADDSTLWRYKDIHPPVGLAVAALAHCPNGVLFDPSKQSFTNTATILLPADEFSDFPFDLILLSDVYVWFYAIGARMGVLRTLRSHIYPTNLSLLPWSNDLAEQRATINAMRQELIEACRSRMAAAESLKNALAVLNLRSLKSRLRDDVGSAALWSDSFNDPDYEATIDNPRLSANEDLWRVQLGPGLFDWLDCNRIEFAEGLVLALKQHEAEELSKSEILNLKIPCSVAEMQSWNDVLTSHQTANLDARMAAAIHNLNVVVGGALGLDDQEIAFIENDVIADPFLRVVKPRYPGTVTRKMGFREGLDSAERYQ